MDDAFIKNLKSNFQKLLSKCNDFSSKSDEKYEFDQKVPILDNSGWLKTEIVKSFDYPRFFSSHVYEIRQTTCYNLLLDLFSENISMKQFYEGFQKEDGRVVENPAASDIRIFVERDFIFEFLKSYSSQKTSFSFDGKLFNEILQNLINFVENESRLAYVFFPLHGLSGDFEKIEFSDQISITNLNPNQFALVTNMDVNFNSRNRPEKRFRKLRYGIFIKIKLEEGQIISSEKIKNEAQKILVSFRLFRSGIIHLGAMYSYSPDFWPRKNLLPPQIGTENPPEEIDLELSVSKDDIGQIKKFFLNFTKFENINLEIPHYLETSIRRFNISYDNKHIGDKIADLCISLETLLSDSPGEITLKLSLRVALLLGDSEDEREYLWRFIKKCYNVRSEIVHGKKRTRIEILGNILTDQQTTQKLERITRKAITKVVLLQGQISKQNELLDLLDCSIVNRTKLLKLERS